MIINLWKCGDLLLNSKIASGVSRVDLRADKLRRSSYPLLVSNLHGLRNLSIESSESIFEDVNQCSRELKKLPQGLKTLKFLAPGLEPFVSADSEVSLRDHVPFLTDFEMTIHSGTVNLDAGLFPPNLTRFGIPSVTLDGTPFFAKLPRSLLTLDTLVRIPWGIATDAILEDLALAPPHLETISDVRTRGSPTDAADWSWLPRSLTKCNLICQDWDPLQARTLPPNLKRLLFSRLDIKEFETKGISVIGTLPRSLEELDISTPRLMDCLPEASSLLDVDQQELISRAEAIQPRIHALWPSTLTTFSINSHCFNTSDLILLPRTLTSFSLSSLFDDRDDDPVVVQEDVQLDRLPPGLTALCVDFGYLHKEFKLIGPLPEGLITLTIQGRSLEASSLPSSLTSLEMRMIDYDAAIGPQTPLVSAFPPSLTTLRLPYWRSDLLKLIPKAVTFLGIDELMLHGTEINCYHIPDVPRNLQTFYAGIALASDLETEVQLPPLSFADLPHLTTLEVTGTFCISSECLKTLPRRLESLNLPLNPFRIEDAQFIPPRLINFFPSISITDDIIPTLASYWPLGSRDYPEEISALVEERLVSRLSAQH